MFRKGSLIQFESFIVTYNNLTSRSWRQLVVEPHLKLGMISGAPEG